MCGGGRRNGRSLLEFQVLHRGQGAGDDAASLLERHENGRVQLLDLPELPSSLWELIGLMAVAIP